VSPADFLAQLDLTDEERRSIASLGVTSAFTLAHMIRASRPSFDRLVGLERAAAVVAQLDTFLTPDERESLERPAPRFSLGAQLDLPPKRDND
jgi:hypothetical protein